MNKLIKSAFPVLAIIIVLFPLVTRAQTIQEALTYERVIELSKERSLQAILARHRFRASYWQFRTHKARFLPSLNFHGNLINYNRSFEKEFDEGRDIYVPKNQNSTFGGLSLRQNVGLTGGWISVNSNLTRFDVFGSGGYTRYVSVPTNIEYDQPMLRYNELKWEKKIEPLRFEEARRNFIVALEQVAIQATNYFFELAMAQINYEVAQINYSNTDTLYEIARGRYNIGTIAENELLQMELSFLNAGTSLNEASIDLEMKKSRLRSFLGYNENVDITLVIPGEIPGLEIEVSKALELARENNPDVLQWQRELLEAKRDVAEAKSGKGLNASLFARYGLTQQAGDFSGAYVDPLNQQGVSLGVRFPILDWGLGKGQYRMALSGQEVVRTSVEQLKIDFEQEVALQIMQFNLQDDQLLIAAKADTIAQNRYEISKQRFLIGKIDVLDLNVALQEKDVAKRGYISTLKNYWNYYYNIRKLTMYDFQENVGITTDFDVIIQVYD
ncbi:MAG: TolC family protein [Bacteroidales bacterium]